MAMSRQRFIEADRASHEARRASEYNRLVGSQAGGRGRIAMAMVGAEQGQQRLAQRGQAQEREFDIREAGQAQTGELAGQRLAQQEAQFQAGLAARKEEAGAGREHELALGTARQGERMEVARMQATGQVAAAPGLRPERRGQLVQTMLGLEGAGAPGAAPGAGPGAAPGADWFIGPGVQQQGTLYTQRAQQATAAGKHELAQELTANAARLLAGEQAAPLSETATQQERDLGLPSRLATLEAKQSLF